MSPTTGKGAVAPAESPTSPHAAPKGAEAKVPGSGHTAGPWTLQLARCHKDSPVFGYSIQAEGKTPYIASAGVAHPQHVLIVHEDYRDTITTGFTEEEVEANARLLAASPALLEAIDHPALRELFGAIEDSGTPEAAKLWALCESWFSVRDAALHLATGGQP